MRENNNRTAKEKYIHRKNEHISLALSQWKKGDILPLNEYKLIRPTLIDNININDIDTSQNIGGHHFKWPIIIEAMTGGTNLSLDINKKLSTAAKNFSLPMAVGSQNIAIKFPSQSESFKIVRKENPNGFLMANIGFTKNYGQALEAVKMIDANALEIHINIAQETAMKDGDTKYEDIFYHINEISEKINVPVILKEVGFGFDEQSLKIINNFNNINAVNISGNNGTDFGIIESERENNDLWNGSDILSNKNIGISTETSLINAKNNLKDKIIISNGGLTSSLDILKSISLGANFSSFAGFFLKQLFDNNLDNSIDLIQKQLVKLFLMYGAKNISQAKKIKNKKTVL